MNSDTAVINLAVELYEIYYDLPSFPYCARTIERGSSCARRLRLVRGVHHALTVIIIGDGRRQRHAVIVRYL